MRIIDAIYPKKRLSEPTPSYRVYRYLLKDLKISYPDQVWRSDITYIRMRRGFAYLVAIMDWYSRYVLSWRLSISLDAQFCIEALKEALLVGKPLDIQF
jgi:putative transposase